jgi:hypothetical protein
MQNCHNLPYLSTHHHDGQVALRALRTHSMHAHDTHAKHLNRPVCSAPLTMQELHSELYKNLSGKLQELADQVSSGALQPQAAYKQYDDFVQEEVYEKLTPDQVDVSDMTQGGAHGGRAHSVCMLLAGCHNACMGQSLQSAACLWC